MSVCLSLVFFVVFSFFEDGHIRFESESYRKISFGLVVKVTSVDTHQHSHCRSLGHKKG